MAGVVDCCSVNAIDSVASVRYGKRAPRWKRAGALLVAVGVALLPKCPACWSVYASLSSLLGMSVVMDEGLLFVLTLTSLALALLSLASVGRQKRVYTPLALGAVSSVGVCLGKFVIESEPLTYLSLLGLILASLGARRWARRGALSPARAEAQN